MDQNNRGHPLFSFIQHEHVIQVVNVIGKLKVVYVVHGGIELCAVCEGERLNEDRLIEDTLCSVEYLIPMQMIVTTKPIIGKVMSIISCST